MPPPPPNVWSIIKEPSNISILYDSQRFLIVLQGGLKMKRVGRHVLHTYLPHIVAYITANVSRAISWLSIFSSICDVTFVFILKYNQCHSNSPGLWQIKQNFLFHPNYSVYHWARYVLFWKLLLVMDKLFLYSINDFLLKVTSKTID